jgi:glycosyltransferase involved in cell wall biosynthesis
MKIAIVVPGRFHAFELAGGLVRRGHDVTLFTNYPRWFVERFDPSLKRVRTCLPHGILLRAANFLPSLAMRQYCSARSFALFARWAAWEIKPDTWDCVHCYSGASEELLESLRRSGIPSLLFRGSAHIRTQARLLREEAERTGARVDYPGEWMVAREEREYRLATKIITLSSFARHTFAQEGVPLENVAVLPLGVDAQFHASDAMVEARCQRILSGAPLRVLFVGTLSMQKGCWDLARIMEALPAGQFEWRLIGHITPEIRSLLPVLERHAHILPQQPHAALPNWYAEADIFLFPTIQDGFAAVLLEAHANALPVLTTPHSAGPDLIINGSTGWILPIRCPKAFVERLRWADQHRPQLADMVRFTHRNPQLRSWDQVAADFETLADG